MIHLSYIILLFILTSANQDSVFDNINIQAFTYQDTPIITSNILDQFGTPDTIKTYKTYDLKTLRTQGKKKKITATEYNYNGLQIREINNEIDRFVADFRHENLIIGHPEITLSSNTQLSDLKYVFPHSYQQLNTGTNGVFRSMLDEQEGERLSWIILYDKAKSNKEYWAVTLSFIDGQLAYMEAGMHISS